MTDSLLGRYRHKIKTLGELAEIVGPFPRDKRVILCHGVFDVVHPGHLRHLVYAKSQADILIASLTADRHIDKGHYRPHVPQDLRALNLAAYEVVDFVLIDEEAKPLKTLERLQPDFFAKGYEYVANGMPVNTREEAEILARYGGEIVFTPGDFVYSSSSLIDLEPPRLHHEKLLGLMDESGVTFDGLRAAVRKLGGRRVHVLGDTIVDSLTRTTPLPGLSKTPTMSVLYEGRSDFVGGAAIVAKHLRAAGAEVTFSTVLGTDPLGAFVRADLAEAGIDCRAVSDADRPTTHKNAIVAGGYRLLKIDTLDNRSISDEVVEALAASLAEAPPEAVVFSDFRHGIFNRRTIPRLVEALPAAAYRVADSQVASRWGNVTDFKGFDLITPNEREARFALADQDSSVRALAEALCDAAQCKLLILKLGEHGVLTCDRSGDAPSPVFALDSFTETPRDAVGAGDALLAYATLAMLSGAGPVIATILGSLAAACECECDGNVPVSPEDLLGRIDAVERQGGYR